MRQIFDALEEMSDPENYNFMMGWSDTFYEVMA